MQQLLLKNILKKQDVRLLLLYPAWQEFSISKYKMHKPKIGSKIQMDIMLCDSY